jgi:1-acyl-sn-glycerol-3-phosphate acyltransferase
MEHEFPLSPSPAYWAAYAPLLLMLRGALKVLAPRWRVTGRQNVPPRGGVLLAPNHISDSDPLLVGLALRRPAWFMAKRELFEMGPLGPPMRFAQAFPVERDSADRSALRRAELLLKNRQALVVFPEGRLSKTGELLPLSPGITMLALRAGVPILPVGIAGSPHLLPYGHFIPRPTAAPIRVHFGPPLDFSDLHDLPSRQAREESTLRLEKALRTAVERAVMDNGKALSRRNRKA